MAVSHNLTLPHLLLLSPLMYKSFLPHSLDKIKKRHPAKDVLDFDVGDVTHKNSNEYNVTYATTSSIRSDVRLNYSS